MLQLLQLYWPILAVVIPVAAQLAHKVIWLGFCGMVLLIDRENASQIIENAGKWAPRSLPTLPWGRGGT
jgi:hypothetical protein